MPLFTWDPDKAEANQRKHGISFAEAVEALNDRFAQYSIDERHTEERWLVTGRVNHKLIMVVYIDDNRHEKTIIRIISARPASKREQEDYYKAFDG